MIKLKEHHNYVAFFLSLGCNLNCSYCINLHDEGSRYKQAKRKELSYKGWIKAANLLELRDDLPLSLQGGEPTLLKGFNTFVKEVKPEIKMDLLTNMMFDVDKFIKEVPVERFTRDAPYASIRVSYHPGQNDIDDLIYKTQKMEDAGFRVGLFGIELPDDNLNKHIFEVKDRCLKLGIDFRTKEFLGEFEGNMYGTFKYKNSVSSNLKSCQCKTTELLVDPNGYVYKCHSDLYAGRNPYANILDINFSSNEIDIYRNCDFYGDCNPCDVKVKTNRFQQDGHTSVDIKDIK
ncbi:MAG: 4Fe-4S cluster-binding domain-containing protein [Campylobacterota bacterium]|nr:4Fe-4S cluster-binding domain-containing protein [Campylobacterota bacterium]